jgi:uncharacterized protein YgbK (DUF1537 family)
MISTLVIADDLTGANAVAAGLVRENLRTIVITYGALIGRGDPRFDDVEAMVVCTDSRDSKPEEIDSRIQAVLSAAPLPDVLSLRVDSTLRGPIGHTISTTLRFLERRYGRRAVALFMPAHPAAGRVTVGAEQRVIAPSVSSTRLSPDVRDVVSTETTLTSHHVPLAAIEGDPGELEAQVHTAYANGSDVLIGDATAEHHLALMCKAVKLACRDLGYTLCLVDPGPTTVEMVRLLRLGHEPLPPVLAISGSVTSVTRRQLERLAGLPGTTVVVPRGLITGNWNQDKRALDRAMSSGARTVLLASALDAADVLPLRPGQASQVTQEFGNLARHALEGAPVSGLYLTGGDIAQAVMSALESDGAVIAGEISPLTSFGYLADGPWSGTPFVSKGGLVGDDDAAIASINHLTLAAYAAATTTACPDRAAKRGSKP